MKEQTPLLLAGRITIASLIVASFGVVIQIASGAHYPRVPPVFFILLIPAGLIVFGRWRWTPVSAVLAGLFLILGFFASGKSRRLIDTISVGDSVGLWVQMLAVLVAVVAGIIATIYNYRSRNVRPGTDENHESQ
jgi:hypothetical protein